MPRGSTVVWREFYRAELNSFRVGEEILERERDWRSRHPSFPRSEYIGRFYDLQGRDQALMWTESFGFRMLRVNKDQERDIRAIRELIDDRMLFVEGTKVTMLPIELGTWIRKDVPGYDERAPNHSRDSLRYLIGGLKERKLIAPGTGAPPEPQPVALHGLERVGTRRRGGAKGRGAPSLASADRHLTLPQHDSEATEPRDGLPAS